MIAIDIGNTSIQVGSFQGRRLGKTFQAATCCDPRTLERTVMAPLKRNRLLADGPEVVICSVVPECCKALVGLLQGRAKVRVVGRDLRVPIKNCYREPQQVGQDRLVGAYAATVLFGCPLIIVDLGTAITLDAVSHRREYLGGAIIPGMRISAESLANKTALLPRVEIHKPRSVIGRDTKGSILSGLFYGYGEMLTGMITLFSRQLQGRPKVVLTGGYAREMSGYISKQVTGVERHLVLKGLQLLVANQESAAMSVKKRVKRL